MRFSNLIRKLLAAAAFALAPVASFAGVFVSVTIAPPALPVYTQPICLEMAICGTRATGHLAMRVTTGFLVCGFGLHRLGCCGRQVTGAGVAACMSSTQDTGGRMSGSTAV